MEQETLVTVPEIGKVDETLIKGVIARKTDRFREHFAKVAFIHTIIFEF